MWRQTIPISDTELERACPGLQTWLYSDLAQLDRLPELPLAVLYETEPSFGHWVGLLRTPEGIEHFDPYGILPDAELKWVPKRYREAFHEDAPHMVRLLVGAQNAGEMVNYNESRLQGRSPQISTCGRWVALRCLNSTMTARQFAKSVRQTAKEQGITPDELVSLLVPV